MVTTPIRAINLAYQLMVVQAKLPAAAGKVKRGQLECILPVQPSPASQTYLVRLRYKHWRPPSVCVKEPVLVLRQDAHVLPHVYPGDELCLYYPGEWRDDMLLATTILPWTAEWLMHYELWLITGQWAGGGVHPPRSAA